ncbi:amidase [Spectribacter hydrogenoxidans]|uniref:Amidase n=1 Tax=Spectribacter hydrogenoxidans TaxID=3075608 RepID=A0ABU3BYG0_9GAMM|nr:amidase [Salinisphaera sp. W335]MDT0634161.1 amidase [Salinisphaera sp. W335]
MTDIADLTAIEMLEAFRAKTLSPVEAADACLARIHALNPAVHAYCQINEEITRAEARAAEKRYQDGTAHGLVDGVPVAVKDIFMAEGWPNLKGSKLIDRHRPADQDAPAVAALRRHGMVTSGRTTTPEFGWKGVTDCPMEGPTGNPWAPDQTAGGSSGGSAAAAVLGMSPLTLGTDAGGSIRMPAGFSGCFGHKPTHGLCPMWPPSAFYPLAHVGPMTWTVDDAALLMNVLAEPDPRDPTLPANRVDFRDGLDNGVRGLRIAFSADFGYANVDPEIAEAVARTVALLEREGAAVESADPGFEDPIDAFNLLFYGGAANAMRDIDAEARKQMDPGLVEVAEWAAQFSLLDYMGAANVRANLVESTSLFHQRFDLLVSPVLPIPAFPKGQEVPDGWHSPRWPSWTPFTYPFNLTGQPAASVPCGFNRDGLPIGLQIVGARHQDAVVLRAAKTLENVAPWTGRRPDWRQTETTS